MSRHGIELRFSSPAVERARARAQERDRARHDGATGRVVGSKVDLIVPLDEFNAGPVLIKEELPQAWVAELVDDRADVKWQATGPAHIEVGLEVEAAFVRVQGEAHFSLLHTCVRCGQRDVPFEVPLVLDLRLVERSPDKEIDADYEQFDDGDDHAGLPLGDASDLEDIDIASYVGNSVDVGAVLREQLFLELPAHPNCESQWSTLNEPCLRVDDAHKLDVEREHSLEVDPRWAGLLNLKEQLVDEPTGPATPSPAITKQPKPAAKPAPKPVPATTIITAPPATESVAAPAAPVAAKKAAPKKPAAKKAASKKPAKKAAAKKAASNKAPTKKPAKKAAAKKPAKKAATKKPAKKAAKKAATKKPAKKAAAKKAAAKKPAKKTARQASAKKAQKKTAARR